VDLLFKHYQIKKYRKSLTSSICDLKLFGNNQFLKYTGYFDLEYSRYGSRRNVKFEHELDICLLNGDITISYRIINDNLTNESIYKSSFAKKKNNFLMLYDLIENGFYRGEKRLNFWGIKYERAINQISLLLCNNIRPHLNSEFYVNKSYKEKSSVSEIYDIIVDFHLSKKNIKGHDNVYYDIMDLYPSKKHLKSNDYKFLPAVLDSLNIKSKYLIKELNVSNLPINILSLNYFCKLFGDNYLEYLKKINWMAHCLHNKILKFKPIPLKNDVEKNSFVKLINNWNSSSDNIDEIFTSINKLVKLREELESKGISISLTPKNDNQINGLIERLSNLKQYYHRGYKVKYVHSEDFINEIEKEIEIDGQIFKVNILTTEEDFINEGIYMKNCMSKQFNIGSLYIFLRGTLKNKNINIQFRKGQLIQSFGKSNSSVPKDFLPFLDVLSQKFKKYQTYTWAKIKYQFINN